MAKILNAEVTNLQEAFEYTCEIFGSIDDNHILDNYYENGDTLKLLKINYNKLNNYLEILDIYKL